MVSKAYTNSPFSQTVESMAPMLRFFRHGDRRLALFNNSVEEDGVLVDLVLTRSETKGRAPDQAAQSGFQRLQAGQSLVIVDTGRPPPQGFDRDAHAGLLSFELSHGRDRIIVNCGGYRGARPAWQRAARASAGHSVLVVADTNAVEVRTDGALGPGPSAVRCERAEDGGHQWIAASHDGYRAQFGLTYLRELYLAGGQLALDKHDFALAAKKFQEGLKQLPNDPDLQCGLAQAYAPSAPAAMLGSLNPHG